MPLCPSFDGARLTSMPQATIGQLNSCTVGLCRRVDQALHASSPPKGGDDVVKALRLPWASHRHWIKCFIQLCLGDLTAFNIAQCNGGFTNGDLLSNRMLGDFCGSLIPDDLIQWGHN